jgi:hypothetical protein
MVIKILTRKKKGLDRTVVAMIALEIVTDAGFQKLVHNLDENFKLPSKTNIKEHLLPQVYKI